MSLLILVGIGLFMVYAAFVQKKAVVSQNLYQANQKEVMERGRLSFALLEESVALQRETNVLLREISTKLDGG